MDADEIVVALQNAAITRYMSAAGLAALLYNHLLTLDDEVEYIWSAQNTVAKMLFLVLRYMVPLFLVAQTVAVTQQYLPILYDSPLPVDTISLTDSLHRRKLSSSGFDCKVWTSLSSYGAWLSISITDFLVLLRICTLLPREHRMVPWSFVFFAFVQITNFACTTWAVHNMLRASFFEPRLGVCTFTSKPNVVGFWIVGIVFEVVVFAAMPYVCQQRARNNSDASADAYAGVQHVLLRDSCVYLLLLIVRMYISSVTAVLRLSSTVIAITEPVSLLGVITFFVWAATTLTTSQMIIHSRRAAVKRREPPNFAGS
ncbi:hypothetical protein GGX14DRAFT_571163 [Mycena pura]|uniref:DUF6533 domain-containing protein n=1 Tax=Mycena pura TaxID=153505 RepID=A0AAD6Y8D3_9AGAR|nr:hypothetical protein GGX14DRAFT_571163 [Mycena pura]